MEDEFDRVAAIVDSNLRNTSPVIATDFDKLRKLFKCCIRTNRKRIRSKNTKRISVEPLRKRAKNLLNYQPEQRRQKVEKYKQKRKQRTNKAIIRYPKRQKIANRRKRGKQGRFKTKCVWVIPP